MLKNIVLATLMSWQLLGGTGRGQTNSGKARESMMLACETKPFLSVSVSTPLRDSISPVQIRLDDPLSREQGVNATGERIPRSQYENVVEIPTLPERSKVHAVEICGAKQGEYALTVYEHGTGLYRIAVHAEVSEVGAMAANLNSREGRTRQYKFLFGIKKGEVYLTWLGKNGQPQLNIGNNDW